jgi:hypothetical protein
MRLPRLRHHESVHRLGRRIGRRGAFLTFLVILDVALGYSLLTLTRAQQLDNLLLPYAVWGWLWVAGAVNAALGVFRRRDVLHYVIAAMIKVAWGSVETNIWLSGHRPHGWVAAAVWLSLALTVLVISGWPEPDANQTVVLLADPGPEGKWPAP